MDGKATPAVVRRSLSCAVCICVMPPAELVINLLFYRESLGLIGIHEVLTFTGFFYDA